MVALPLLTVEIVGFAKGLAKDDPGNLQVEDCP
jgi:hypothetical protein